MTVQDNPIPQEEPAKPAESPDDRERAARKERNAKLERERVVREAEDEIGAIFAVHEQLQQAVQSVITAAETAIGHGAVLDKKVSSGRLGRRLYLGRRLGLKVVMNVLVVARNQLKKASAQMAANVRLRDALLEEATDPELDH